MKKYISKVVLLLICTCIVSMLDPGFFRKNSVYAESKNGKKMTKPTTNTEKEKFSIVTIIVPENYEEYSGEMQEFIQAGGEDPLKNTRFVKKKVKVPYTKDLIRASAQAASELLHQGCASDICYFKIEDGTAYFVTPMYVDGWAGVSVSIGEIYPIIEKTLLQFDKIKHVGYWFAPSDLKIKSEDTLTREVLKAYNRRVRHRDGCVKNPIEKKIVQEIENLEDLAESELEIICEDQFLQYSSQGCSLLFNINLVNPDISYKTGSDIIFHIKNAVELAKRLSNSSAMKSDKVYNKVVAEFIDVIKENLVKYRNEIDTMCAMKKKIKPVLVNYIVDLNSLKSKIESEYNYKSISNEVKSEYFNIEELKGKLLEFENEINLLDTELLQCNSIMDMIVKLNDDKNNTLINLISLAEAKKEIYKDLFLIDNVKFTSANYDVKSEMVFNKARECLKSIGLADELDKCINKLNDLHNSNSTLNICNPAWYSIRARGINREIEEIKTKYLELGINEDVKKGIKDIFLELSKCSLSAKYSYKLTKLRLLYEEKFKDNLFDAEKRISPESEEIKKKIHEYLNEAKKCQKELIDFLKSIDEDPKNYGCDMRVFDDIDME